MINASEAYRMTTKAIEKESNGSPHFKFAMKKIEEYIKKAASQGNRSFCYNLYALEFNNHDGYSGYPSTALRQAIAEELRKNGYSYHEKNIMNIRRGWNNAFEVSW